MYDLVVLGEKIKTLGLKCFQLEPDLLIKCRGEIGNFQLFYKDEQGEIEEIISKTIVVNMVPRKIKTDTLYISFEEELPLIELSDNGFNDPLIFIQDYMELSSAFMNNLGLQKAILAAERNPQSNIYYFYRSMKFMAYNDHLFEKARLLGVIFLKYERGQLEIVEPDEINYHREEPLKLKGKIITAVDYKPADNLHKIGKILNLKMDDKGYLQPENIYLQPVYSGRRGVYLLGGARGKTAYTSFEEENEYIINEIGALPAVIKPITEDRREIDDQKCILCYTCYRICPHGALECDEKLDAMRVLELACQGCNSCISRCPGAAITILENRHKEESDGELTVFLCENSAWQAWKKMPDKERFDDFNIESVPCAGCIEKKEIYFRLRNDERLFIIGCFKESCKHLSGDQKAERLIKEVNDQLNILNLGDNRVIFARLSSRMEEDLKELLLKWQSAGKGEAFDSSQAEKSR